MPHLLAGLLLLSPWAVGAQTNVAKAAGSSHRWLMVVETSKSMQRRADAGAHDSAGLAHIRHERPG